jgi:hypothetical protein
MEIPAEDSRRHNLNRAEAENEATDPQGSPPDLTLEQITRSAQHVTGASGAALALSDGTVMSCRACSGYLAPPLGTHLNTDTGLTATCVQTAEIVRCDDTEADPRVDSSKCIGIRSILAVPIFNGPNVAGVLEVLCSKPNRFVDRHVTALELLARLVETYVKYASRGNGALDAPSSAAMTATKDSAAAAPDAAKVLCLTCGQGNPQGSQFCNRCGVILLISPDSTNGMEDFSLPEGADSTANEGLKEIYKLISENVGLESWQDISAKLLASLQSSPVPDKPRTAPVEAVTKSEETVEKLGRTEGNNQLAAGQGTTIRRRLWL